MRREGGGILQEYVRSVRILSQGEFQDFMEHKGILIHDVVQPTDLKLDSIEDAVGPYLDVREICKMGRSGACGGISTALEHVATELCAVASYLLLAGVAYSKLPYVGDNLNRDI